MRRADVDLVRSIVREELASNVLANAVSAEVVNVLPDDVVILHAQGTLSPSLAERISAVWRATSGLSNAFIVTDGLLRIEIKRPTESETP